MAITQNDLSFACRIASQAGQLGLMLIFDEAYGNRAGQYVLKDKNLKRIREDIYILDMKTFLDGYEAGISKQ